MAKIDIHLYDELYPSAICALDSISLDITSPTEVANWLHEFCIEAINLRPELDS